MRLDSPFVLAFAGTIALHTIAVVAADAVVVIYPYRPAPPAPRIDLIDVEVPPVVKPPPPPVKEETPPEPVKPEAVKPKVRAKQEVRPAAPQPPPPPDRPPPETSSGGAPEIAMPDLASDARGVGVATGPRSVGKIGRGGTGGGTGAGSGAGTATEAPTPVSVATIKTLAKPKGDYDYTKDYPAEAKQLGIEGVILVRLIVDDKGKVRSAMLLNKLGHGLDELAMSRALQIEFEPAKDTDDKPVSSVVTWTFRMTLPK